MKVIPVKAGQIVQSSDVETEKVSYRAHPCSESLPVPPTNIAGIHFLVHGNMGAIFSGQIKEAKGGAWACEKAPQTTSSATGFRNGHWKSQSGSYPTHYNALQSLTRLIDDTTVVRVATDALPLNDLVTPIRCSFWMTFSVDGRYIEWRRHGCMAIPENQLSLAKDYHGFVANWRQFIFEFKVGNNTGRLAVIVAHRLINDVPMYTIGFATAKLGLEPLLVGNEVVKHLATHLLKTVPLDVDDSPFGLDLLVTPTENLGSFYGVHFNEERRSLIEPTDSFIVTFEPTSIE